jgi:CHAT domain-containing protein/tetratricopeptide (TPR) repeat protein
LLGAAPVPLPESDEETERWRLATVEALDLPPLRAALAAFLSADDYDDAVGVVRDTPELLSPRWRLTIDTLGDLVVLEQVDEDAADLLRNRLGRLRQLQLLGLDHTGDSELTGDIAEMVNEATSTTDDHAKRVDALRRLIERLADLAPTALVAAAYTSLVAALHGEPTRLVTGTELLATARQALIIATDVLGPDHLLTHSATLNLAVVTEERTDVPRARALAEAQQILDDLAPRAARAGTVVVADVATNYATIAAQQPGQRADNPEATADLLADARHIAALLKHDDRRSRLVMLIDEAATLRARMTGSFRANAEQSIALLREALALEAEWHLLSPPETVLLLGNIANASHQLHELAPDKLPAAEVRAAAQTALDSTAALGRLHAIAIDSIANAGSILASLYSESVIADDPDIQLWHEAHDYLEDAMARATENYPPGHPVRLRVALNFATVFGRPVAGLPADPERCAQLLGDVIAETPDERAEFTLAAAQNLGQLRMGQGLWQEAADAYEIATGAQRRLVQRARTAPTKLGEIMSTADLAARRALALGMLGHFAAAAAALDDSRGRLVGQRRPAGPPTPGATGVAVVHAATCDYGTIVTVRLPDGARFGLHSTITAGQIKPIVQQLLIAPDRDSRRACLDELEGLLGAELIDPIAAVARASIIPLEELHIVACGPLAACPLHAIRDNRANRLIDQWTVRYRLASNTTDVPAQPAPDYALAIIDPVGDLPFARAEREALAGWIPEVREVPAGWSARRWLLSSLAGAQVVHLACHARSNPDDPMRSSFTIADDETVAVTELAGLKAPNLNLVVAPACQSASANPHAPDELLGVAHALVHAGARSVIASLWDADDAATALVVARLYHELTGGRHPAIALTAAQRYAASVTGPDLALLARRRLDDDVQASWLPYDLAIEFLALTAHPDYRSVSRPCFGHPADWAALTYLEA